MLPHLRILLKAALLTPLSGSAIFMALTLIRAFTLHGLILAVIGGPFICLGIYMLFFILFTPLAVGIHALLRACKITNLTAYLAAGTLAGLFCGYFATTGGLMGPPTLNLPTDPYFHAIPWQHYAKGLLLGLCPSLCMAITLWSLLVYKPTPLQPKIPAFLP